MLPRYHAHNTQIAYVLLASLAVFSAGPSLAGRPLTVDDANVNDMGAGHVETWFSRQVGAAEVLTVAPAYGVAQGIEIGMAFARDTGNQVSTTSMQAKFRLSPSRDRGCNAAATLGATQSNANGASAPFVNGVVTCNAEFGSVHLNVGAIRPPQGQTLGTWGIAIERGFGSFTAHMETFGQEQMAPTVQLGLRTDVAKNVQCDGTIGRVNSETVLSLGMKFQF